MNSRRLLLALAVTALALLAGLAWFLTRRGSPSSAPSSVASDDYVHAAAVTGPNDTTAEAALVSRARTEARVSATVAPALPAFASFDGLRVVVLESGTRTPVPGAVVRVWEAPSDDWGLTLDYAQWIGPDLEAHMVAKGHATTTDEHGEFDLPATTHMRFVTARFEDSFTFERFAAMDHGSAELVLQKSHTIQVRVLDERRAPRAHVVVGLGDCDDFEAFWKLETDERGVCRVHDLESILAERGHDPNSPLAVFAAVPCSPRVEEWIDPSRVPSGVVELVLPATGNIRVQIVDEGGRVMPLAGRVALVGRADSVNGAPRFGNDSIVVYADIVEGVARVRDVGLGLSFELEADLHGTGDVSGFVVGPVNVNEEVTIALPFASDHTLLSGRLVDEDGRPLANRTLDWRRILDDGLAIQATGRDKLKTDGDGRFTWTLRRSAASTGFSTHRTGFLCEDGEGAVRAQATVHFPLEIAQAATDLGEITLKRSGPLVSGRVVDAADRGLPGVTIVPRIHTGDGSYSDADTFDPVMTDRDGRFALFGPCLGLDFRVHAQGPGIVEPQLAAVPCRDGPVEITFRAQAFGGLEGSALVDHDAGDELTVIFERDAATTTTTPTEGSDAIEYADWWRAGDRICFRWTGVRPGHGTVRFHSPSEETAPCLVVRDVEIVGATTSRPLALVDVDLRGKVTKRGPAVAESGQVDYTVVDSAGHPIARGVVWTWSEDGDWDAQRYFAGGRVRVATEQARKIEVWAPGHRAHTLDAPFTGGRIVLGPMIELDVRIEMPREFADEHWTLTGRIWPNEPVAGELSTPTWGDKPATGVPTWIPSQAATGIEGFHIDHKGRGVVSLPAAGTYGLGLELTHIGSGDGSVEGYAITIDPSTVVVRDADGRQVVPIRIPAEAVQQCLDDLGLSK